MDGTLSQMAVSGKDPVLKFAKNLSSELRSHRGRGEPSVMEQLHRIKDRVEEMTARDKRRARRRERRKKQQKDAAPDALAARQDWKDSVQARLQKENDALTAKIAADKQAQADHVAAMTRGVLGPGYSTLRMTGRLAGAESDFGRALRHGGVGVRGNQDMEQHPAREGRRGQPLHGRRSVAEHGTRSESVEAQATAAAAQGRQSAPPELPDREVTGCLPAIVIGRNTAKEATVPYSLYQETVGGAGRGHQPAKNNPHHAREWGKLLSTSVARSPGRDENADESPAELLSSSSFGRLKGNIRSLQKEAERIDSVLGTRTRVTQAMEPAFPVRAEDKYIPEFSRY